jgi:hypothetical protein
MKLKNKVAPIAFFSSFGFFWDFYGEKTPSEVDEGVHACP